MIGYDLWQVVVGASCIVCVTPVLILLITLRLAVALECFLVRHSLLLWLLPISLWLKANQQEEEQRQGSGRCRR